MKIYQISDNTYGEREITGEKIARYAYAGGYGPLPQMPFLDLMPIMKVRFQRYWQVNPEEPGLHINPGGRAWPDFLGCGNSPPHFFVSDTVIEDLEANGIPIWRKTEFPIAEIDAKALRDKKPPRYFVVEAEPGIAVDYPASGIALGANGKPVYTNEQRLHPPILQLDPKSWSGADLFTFTNVGGGSRIRLLCTEKVLELAKKERWRNVEFQRQAILGVDPFASLRKP